MERKWEPCVHLQLFVAEFLNKKTWWVAERFALDMPKVTANNAKSWEKAPQVFDPQSKRWTFLSHTRTLMDEHDLPPVDADVGCRLSANWQALSSHCQLRVCSQMNLLFLLYLIVAHMCLLVSLG